MAEAQVSAKSVFFNFDLVGGGAADRLPTPFPWVHPWNRLLSRWPLNCRRDRLFQ